MQHFVVAVSVHLDQLEGHVSLANCHSISGSEVPPNLAVNHKDDSGSGAGKRQLVGPVGVINQWAIGERVRADWCHHKNRQVLADRRAARRKAVSGRTNRCT